MTNQELTKNELNKIRKMLPHGAIKRIAESLSVTPELVSMVLYGKRKRSDVLKLALEEIEAYKQAQQQLKEAIKAL